MSHKMKHSKNEKRMKPKTSTSPSRRSSSPRTTVKVIHCFDRDILRNDMAMATYTDVNVLLRVEMTKKKKKMLEKNSDRNHSQYLFSWESEDDSILANKEELMFIGELLRDTLTESLSDNYCPISQANQYGSASSNSVAYTSSSGGSSSDHRGHHHRHHHRHHHNKKSGSNHRFLWNDASSTNRRLDVLSLSGRMITDNYNDDNVVDGIERQYCSTMRAQREGEGNDIVTFLISQSCTVYYKIGIHLILNSKGEYHNIKHVTSRTLGLIETSLQNDVYLLTVINSLQQHQQQRESAGETNSDKYNDIDNDQIAVISIQFGGLLDEEQEEQHNQDQSRSSDDHHSQHDYAHQNIFSVPENNDFHLTESYSEDDSAFSTDAVDAAAIPYVPILDITEKKESMVISNIQDNNEQSQLASDGTIRLSPLGRVMVPIAGIVFLVIGLLLYTGRKSLRTSKSLDEDNDGSITILDDISISDHNNAKDAIDVKKERTLSHNNILLNPQMDVHRCSNSTCNACHGQPFLFIPSSDDPNRIQTREPGSEEEPSVLFQEPKSVRFIKIPPPPSTSSSQRQQYSAEKPLPRPQQSSRAIFPPPEATAESTSIY